MPPGAYVLRLATVLVHWQQYLRQCSSITCTNNGQPGQAPDWPYVGAVNLIMIPSGFTLLARLHLHLVASSPCILSCIVAAASCPAVA